MSGKTDETNVTNSKRRDASGRGEARAGNVWLRPRRTSRDEPPLTRTRIVEEAVALLDEDGLGRLTMRRLAERLGTGSTTLYWHVDTKDDVLDLALDAIFAEVPLPPKNPQRTEHWWADIHTLIGGWRATMLRHPWTAALPGRPMIGPNILARIEFLQATLVRAGLTGPHLSAATWGLYNHVMGATAAEAGQQMRTEERKVAQERLQAERDRYPTLAAHGYALDEDWDGNFARVLDYLLDGIEARHRATDEKPTPRSASNSR